MPVLAQKSGWNVAKTEHFDLLMHYSNSEVCSRYCVLSCKSANPGRCWPGSWQPPACARPGSVGKHPMISCSRLKTARAGTCQHGANQLVPAACSHCLFLPWDHFLVPHAASRLHTPTHAAHMRVAPLPVQMIPMQQYLQQHLSP